MISSLTTIARYQPIGDILTPLMLPEHLHARISLRGVSGADPLVQPPPRRRLITGGGSKANGPSTIQREVDDLVCEAVAALVDLCRPSVTGVERAAQRALRDAVPLATRLGMWQLKRSIEDVALRTSMPERALTVEKCFERFKNAHWDLVEQTCEQIREALRQADVNVEVRPAFCGLAGVFRRLGELGIDESFRGAPITEFYDLSVIVHSEADCYGALAAVHRAGTPIPGTLRDLVAAPQPNGFSALFTQIAIDVPQSEDHAVVAQVNVRTDAMDSVARYGVVARECYSRLASYDEDGLDDAPRCVAQLLRSLGRSVPRARMTVLAEGHQRLAKAYGLSTGATVLDLAYKIHSEIGHLAVWARVNKRSVALNHVLHPYDRVDIMIDPKVKRTEDDLAFITTRTALRHLRRELNRSEVVRGRRLLKQYLEAERAVILDRTELDRISVEIAAGKSDMRSDATPEDLYRAISKGNAREDSPGFVGAMIVALLSNRRSGISVHEPPNIEWVLRPPRGTAQIPHKIKLCGRCSPPPLSTVVGVVLAKSVTAHDPECKLIARAAPTVRLEWRRESRGVDSTLGLFCQDRPRLVHDICERIAQRGAGLAETHATTDAFSTARIVIRVYTRSAIELGKLMDDLRSVAAVRVVELEKTTLPDDEKDLVLMGGWRRVRGRQSRGAPWSPLQAGNRRGRYADVVIPYNEQRPVFDMRNFFGRDEEAMQLSKQVLGDAPSMVFLAAPRRSGKTSLALRFLDTLDARERPHRIRVDLRAERSASSERILRMIAAALKPVATSSVEHHDDPCAEIASIVSQSSRRVLLILDEFGAALESYCAGRLGDGLFAWMRSALEMAPGDHVGPTSISADKLRFILISPPEGLELLAEPGPSRELGGRIMPMHLGPLDRDSVAEMAVRPFREAGVYFAPSAVSDVADVTGCLPYFLIPLLKALATHVNRHTHKQDVSTRDIAEVTRSLIHHPILVPAAVNEPGGRPEHYRCLKALAPHRSSSDLTFDAHELVCASGLDVPTIDDVLHELRRFNVVERFVASGEPDKYAIAVPIVRTWAQTYAKQYAQRRTASPIMSSSLVT